MDKTTKDISEELHQMHNDILNVLGKLKENYSSAEEYQSITMNLTRALTELHKLRLNTVLDNNLNNDNYGKGN